MKCGENKSARKMQQLSVAKYCGLYFPLFCEKIFRKIVYSGDENVELKTKIY